MKQHTVVGLSAAFAVCVAACVVPGHAQRPGGRSEEEAVKAVIVATTEAFNAHDAKAYRRLCTPDADLVTVRGEIMKGIAEIEKGLSAIFQTRNRNAILNTLDVRVRFIRPDVAVAHVTNQLSGVLTPHGQQLPAHRELSVRVFVKNQGVWRMTAFHNTMLQN